MYFKTAEESITLAEEFISKYGILDEDTKQDIFVKALESEQVGTKQEVTRKFTRVVDLHNSNKDDIYVAVNGSTAFPFNVFETVDHDILHNQLNDIMSNTITEREKKILELRYIDGMTQKEVGKLFHLTSSRISAIEYHAMRRLRHPSRLKLLDGFLAENPVCPVAKNNYRRVEYN